MDFNEQNLRSALSGKMMGNTLHFFPETESTNTLAFRLADAGAKEGTVVIADSQTQGRGRIKRKWESPPGLNLYTSLILKPDINPARSSPITLTAGVAVAELFSLYCPGKVHLKWPNDVLINGRKVCGILTEIKTEGKKLKFIVLGVGININMKRADFPPPLEEIATSLREETGHTFSRVEVAAGLYEILDKFYNIFLIEGFASIREWWLAYSLMSGKHVEVTCGGEILQGKVTGIDDGGALILQGEDGMSKHVIAGDASLIRV